MKDFVNLLITMRKFLVVIEKAKRNFSADCPDLPGCIATGKTLKEVEGNIFEAIKMHVEGLTEDHRPIPQCKAISEYIVVE